MKLNLVLLEVKINTLLDRFIKEIRKRTQINKIKMKNEKQQRCQEIQTFMNSSVYKNKDVKRNINLQLISFKNAL